MNKVQKISRYISILSNEVYSCAQFALDFVIGSSANTICDKGCRFMNLSVSASAFLLD